MAEEYLLPDQISKLQENEVIFMDYAAKENSIKVNFHLTSNMISLIQRGVKKVVTLEGHVIAGNSSFMIARPGHCVMTETIHDGGSFQSILLLFSDARLRRFLEKGRFKSNFRNDIGQVEKIEYNKMIRNWVSSVKMMPELSGQKKREWQDLKFEELMYLLMRIPKANQFFSAGFIPSDRHLDFKAIMEISISRNLTLEELAFLCNMSVSSFCRAFKEVYNEAPMSWFQKRRIHNASMQLRVAGTRVIEVANSSGFNSASSFIRAFKKEFGMTPKRYQQIWLEGEDES